MRKSFTLQSSVPSNPLMQPTNAGDAGRRPTQHTDGKLRNVGSHRSFAADLHLRKGDNTHRLSSRPGC
jgi:hypothetical protein